MDFLTRLAIYTANSFCVYTNMRFWIEDEFIDKYAKTLSLKAQAIYVCLKRHCNRQGYTTIGIRGIAEKLNINKETANKGIKELILSGFVGQRPNKLSGFSPYTVRPIQTDVSDKSRHKELGIIKGIANEFLNKKFRCLICQDKMFVENSNNSMTPCLKCNK